MDCDAGVSPAEVHRIHLEMEKALLKALHADPGSHVELSRPLQPHKILWDSWCQTKDAGRTGTGLPAGVLTMNAKEKSVGQLRVEYGKFAKWVFEKI